MKCPNWATDHLELTVADVFYNDKQYLWFAKANPLNTTSGEWEKGSASLKGYLKNVQHLVVKHTELNLTLENE